MAASNLLRPEEKKKGGGSKDSLPLSTGLFTFCCPLHFWSQGFSLRLELHHQLSASQAIQNTTGFLGPLACRQQILGLLILHRCIRQYLTINLNAYIFKITALRAPTPETGCLHLVPVLSTLSCVTLSKEGETSVLSPRGIGWL